MKKDERHRQLVKERLEHIVGYKADVIQQGEEQSADLFAYAGDDKLLLEVKSRVDDLDVVRTLREAPAGTEASRDALMERSAGISRIVHEAVGQLQTSMRHYDGVPIMWFIPDPVLGMSDADQLMEATLLGIRWVMWRSDTGWGYAPCYLAGRTDFHKYPMLAAASVDFDDGAKLLINPYTPHLSLIRKSRLYEFFAHEDAVVDLEFKKSSTSGLILFGDFDRADDRVVLEKLSKQHPEFGFQFVDMHGLGGYRSFSV